MAEINARERAELCNFITRQCTKPPRSMEKCECTIKRIKVLLGYSFALVCGNELEVYFCLSASKFTQLPGKNILTEGQMWEQEDNFWWALPLWLCL